jgi:hypothetical protein
MEYIQNLFVSFLNKKIDYMPFESVSVCPGIILILLPYLNGNRVALFDPHSASEYMSPFHFLNQLTKLHET